MCSLFRDQTRFLGHGQKLIATFVGFLGDRDLAQTFPLARTWVASHVAPEQLQEPRRRRGVHLSSASTLLFTPLTLPDSVTAQCFGRQPGSSVARARTRCSGSSGLALLIQEQLHWLGWVSSTSTSNRASTGNWRITWLCLCQAASSCSGRTYAANSHDVFGQVGAHSQAHCR